MRSSTTPGNICVLDDEGVKCWGQNRFGQVDGFEMVAVNCEALSGYTIKSDETTLISLSNSSTMLHE